jgi:hypothetical protein
MVEIEKDDCALPYHEYYKLIDGEVYEVDKHGKNTGTIVSLTGDKSFVDYMIRK